MARTEDNYGLPNHWPMISSLHYRAGLKRQPVFDAKADAARQAAAFEAGRDEAVYGGLRCVLRDAPRVDRGALLADLVAFHRESRERVPSGAAYPEAAFWVDYTLTLERELRRLAGLSEEELALVRSLGS